MFLFNKVSAHFEVIVEIYSKLVSSSTSTSSLVKDAETLLGKTPQKIVKSISKAVGRKLLMHNLPSVFYSGSSDTALNKELDNVFNVGPKFELIASATLSLDQCSNGKCIIETLKPCTHSVLTQKWKRTSCMWRTVTVTIARPCSEPFVADSLHCPIVARSPY